MDQQQKRRNTLMAWAILAIGFGTTLGLIYAGKFFGSR